MKTEILVAFVSDPYIALYFWELYEKNFKDEIDGLLVHVNGARLEVVDFIGSIYKDSKVLNLHYDHSNQGIAFDELYKEFKGDVLGTMCSDNFIYQKGIIKSEIERLQEYDVVGSKGLHASPPAMADKIDAKIGLCRINPFMSFWRADKLKQIEPFTFQTVEKEIGDRLEYLNMDYEGEGRLDIMTDMSIKFIANGNKAFIHGADNPPYWMHASGLSSGVYGHLMHSDGKNLAGTDRNYDNVKVQIGLLGWWYLIYEKTVDKCPLKDFNNEYLNALQRKAEICGVTWDQVKKDSKRRDYEKN